VSVTGGSAPPRLLFVFRYKAKKKVQHKAKKNNRKKVKKVKTANYSWEADGCFPLSSTPSVIESGARTGQVFDNGSGCVYRYEHGHVSLGHNSATEIVDIQCPYADLTAEGLSDFYRRLGAQYRTSLAAATGLPLKMGAAALRKLSRSSMVQASIPFSRSGTKVQDSADFRATSKRRAPVMAREDQKRQRAIAVGFGCGTPANQKKTVKRHLSEVEKFRPPATTV